MSHWETVYTTKTADSVSWFQPQASRSLAWIANSGIPHHASIIDIGGGASTLVDDLLAQGYTQLAVLDLSTAALAIVQQRLGDQAKAITWHVGDITQQAFPANSIELWHDRAVFHFLTQPEQRDAYRRLLNIALVPQGHLIIATFAEDGPEKCSGLPVMRYSAAQLAAEIGDNFRLLKTERESHFTPFGTEQSFIYCHFQKVK